MGLGALFHSRDIVYDVTDTVSGAHDVFRVVNDLVPDFSLSNSYRGALSIPGAWRSATLISDLIGSVPWHAFRRRGGRPMERLDPAPPLLEQPYPPYTRMSTMSTMALDLILHGNAVSVIATRDRAGTPTSVIPVPAQYVGVRRAGTQDPTFPAGALIYSAGGREWESSDILHVMGPADPGATRGMGVLEAHLRGVLSLADDQGRQALSLSGSAVPTGVLRVADTPADPLTRAEASAVKEGWIRSQSSRTVAVLNARTTFEPIAWNPTEGQMLEARQFSLHEIALIFGLDPSWLGVSGSSMTYSNIEQQAVNLVKFTLRGHISRIEQTLSLLFPRGTFVEANLDGILRGDTAARYDAHVKALSAGFLTVDEVREMEGRPPLPSPTTRGG